MTGKQTSHVTVSYTNGRSDITRTYAVNEDILQELDRHKQNPTGKDLQSWLENKGCRLDSADGPAFARSTTDGSTHEVHYRAGKMHRENGPAVVRRDPDGTVVEEYYRDGKRHREDGPAIFTRFANGSIRELYYRDGKTLPSHFSLPNPWRLSAYA